MFTTYNNNDEELTYIKICQSDYKYLVIEHTDKNSNGLSLFFKLVNQNRIRGFRKIILHHEATPMKYLVDKISSYENVFIMTKKEILNEKF
jgi:hypothetical protein